MKVDITLDQDETIEEAEDNLFKALSHQRQGDTHKEDFHQPSARAVCKKLISAHAKTMKAIYQEIEEALDEEVYQ